MKLAVSVIVALLATLAASPSLAQEKPLTLDVWPGNAPGETGEIGEEKYQDAQPGQRQVQRLTNVTKPTIAVFKPPKEKDTGAAVLICPGGGYNILALDLEGTEVAQWLNTIGVTGIVLKYRVPKRPDQPKHAAPLKDAQRAMSLVRSHASAWGLDPKRIGILGFSAGGHLAATASTNFDLRQYETIDATDAVDCRPDFTVLIYPAYLAEGEKLTPEIRVTSQSPPTFFVHAGDDRIGPENSARMYLALKQAGVPGELHIYTKGGHGFGLRPSADAVSTWPKRCEEWLVAGGWLAAKGK
jgi:acetyl esterase/lipase